MPSRGGWQVGPTCQATPLKYSASSPVSLPCSILHEYERIESVLGQLVLERRPGRPRREERGRGLGASAAKEAVARGKDTMQVSPST